MDQNNPAPSVSASLPRIEGPLAILKASWNLFVKHWKSIVPIVILPSVVGYIGTLFTLFKSNVFFGVIGAILSIVGGVLSVAAVAALTGAIHRLSIDPNAQISLKEQYRFGFTLFWSIVLVGLITMLVMIGSIALLVIPGIIVGVYIGLYTYALVVDGKKGFGALLESYDLVRGRWMPVFGRAAFLGLISMLAWIIIGAVMYPFVGNDMFSQAIGGLINIAATAVLTPIAIGYSYRLYTNLKSLRQPEISLKKFKKWLVALLCIGVLAIIILFLTIPLVALNGFRSSRMSAENTGITGELQMAEIQRLIQEAAQSASTTAQ
ncbi:MAG: hypothetical protein AAB365_04265 [Patescibacteria group bacterium]